MRFYGMSLQHYRALTARDAEGLWQAITVIEAREQLVQYKAADWPSLKKTERSKQHKELHRNAFPASLRNTNGPIQTTADLAAVLARGSKRA